MQSEVKVGNNIARLVSIEGSAKGLSFYLVDKNTFAIGSSAQADVYLPNDAILGEHAKVEKDEDSYVINDLSGGKTFVNGDPIDLYVLQEGDHLRVGFDILVFNFREVTEGNLKSIEKDIETSYLRDDDVGDNVASIEVLEGLSKGVSYPLQNKKVFLVGRSSNNDIKIVDSKISRTHCKIELEDGEFILFDNASTNGVFVNGEKKDIHPLENGDHIKIGFTVLQFNMPESKPTTNDIDDLAFSD